MAPIQRQLILSHGRYENGNRGEYSSSIEPLLHCHSKHVIFLKCGTNTAAAGSMRGTAQIRAHDRSKPPMKHSSSQHCPDCADAAAAAAAQCRPRADLDLPAHAVAAGRLQLPPSADLLGLWRRGDRALRAVGRRMDDAGAAVALPALGHLGDRQRAADSAAAARDGICPGGTDAGAASTRRDILAALLSSAGRIAARAGNRGGRVALM